MTGERQVGCCAAEVYGPDQIVIFLGFGCKVGQVLTESDSMTEATLIGWRFDPAFSNNPGLPAMPDDWDFLPDSSMGGSALALDPYLTRVTLVDGDGDGKLGSGGADSLVLDSITYGIVATYPGDEAVIDGTTNSLVTIYATNGDPNGELVVVSFPLVDGQIAPAFGGDVTSTYVSTTNVPVPMATGSVPCLTRGTLVDTPSGPVRVERLRVGDLVLTRDEGPQPIRWIASVRLEPWHLRLRPELCPVLIPRGALGVGQPDRDLRVSPQHRMLLRSPIGGRMFAANEVLVAAHHLTGVAGIRRDTTAERVEYFHLVTDRHAIIRANGAETETMFPGSEALKSLPVAARRELETLFPGLREGLPEGARPFVKGRNARTLIARHQRNGKVLVAG